MIITGNSGSGKTWLATHLSAIHHCQVIHLDHIFWQPGGFSEKRSPEVVNQMIDAAKRKESWIVEGVFGELAEKFMDRADCFIWLDTDWSLCRDRLRQRGSESCRHMGRSNLNRTCSSFLTGPLVITREKMPARMTDIKR